MSERDNGIGCFTVLALIFVVLKLTGNIDWSWLWVLSPIWIPVAIVIVFLGFVLVMKK